MKEQIVTIIKKFWFVILVGCIFCSFAIYFAWDTNKDKIPGKSVGRQDIIFSAADVNYTADEYYDSLFNISNDGVKNGISQLYLLLEKTVAQQLDVTKEMKEEVKASAEAMASYYKSLYGTHYDSYMNMQLQMLGYEGVDELEEFLMDQTRLDQIIFEYLEKNDTLVDAVFTKYQPRVISHILVACDDPANPTDAEKAKMAEIKKALKDKEFGTVAAEYSDDTGTISTNGSLGLQLNNASLVTEFLNAAWKLENGKTSDWVKTEYGYHLIKIDETSQKKIMNDETYRATIISQILSDNTDLKKKIVWDKAEQLNVKFSDETILKEMKAYIGIKDETEDKE